MISAVVEVWFSVTVNKGLAHILGAEDIVWAGPVLGRQGLKDWHVFGEGLLHSIFGNVTISFLFHVFFLISVVRHPYFSFAPSYQEIDLYLLAFPDYSSPLLFPL